MASLVTLGATVLALSLGAKAEASYQLADSYDYTNFFDKFNFFESRYDTGVLEDYDPTHGFVRYRNKQDAHDLGLINTLGEELYLGVDHATILKADGKGRNSVRIESKQMYKRGLIIADFTYLPPAKCGQWPAFWTYGDNWPNHGEVDIYESWNLDPRNRQTVHVGHNNGSCTITQSAMTNTIGTSNCDNFADGQYTYQGCSSEAYDGPYQSPSGGVCKSRWSQTCICASQ